MADDEIDFAVEDENGNGVAAEVFLRITPAGGHAIDLTGMSDHSGMVSFKVPPFATFECLLVRAVGFWSAYSEDIEDCGSITMIRLPDVEEPAWWLECLGIDTGDFNRGANIKIGVVDTGFGKAEGIQHVREVVGAKQREEDDYDGAGHGEIVCRVLGDRSERARRWMSVAPGAEIFFADASHDDDRETISSLRAQVAINLLVRAGVDLINLSWGEPFEDEGVLAAIEAASRLGVTIIAASGNDPNEQRVYFPARHESCIAVSAFGRSEWGEPGTLVAYDRTNSNSIGTSPSGDEIYLWCNNTCGSEVDAIAPGVGILVQRNNRIHAAVSGTSFAAPLACGTLAVALGQDEAYLRMARSEDRTRYARRAFLKMCRSVGFDRLSEGSGSPFAAARGR
ncbi:MULTISPECIES: S8/S53 family peptidase [unclassified Bradyrhizobium]|uniref:S8 family peptidase n=1 Tax=unclassified Bradyrhizobium TaxID=2631580 RepID=UPI001FFA9153|nr:MULTISPECIES: S8/S53 family peptidase [unclassified Bradyrhizobium]MCK1412372.1 S8/S53 family peptidase [Bradyrhizobium sp. CW4]UPJ26533.1 S8/S53 family peptidase [Bradyrhizobium sp. CW1]